MAMVIMHTGQSGVERGADRAARVVDIAIGGTCSFEARDELGLLPPAIAKDLVRASRRGVRSALYDTLAASHALVIAVPDARHANAITGVEALRREARRLDLLQWVIDPTTDLDHVAGGLRRLELEHRELRVMVTGPRSTRWLEGERMGWRVVTHLSLTTPVQRKQRILVVDDYADTVDTTCAYLRALGHECESATTAEAGLLAAATFDPDIALLDIGLPDLSGYEVARRLRAKPRDQPVFIAAITGWNTAKDIETAMAAGFDRHVVKPAGADVLRTLVDEASQRL